MTKTRPRNAGLTPRTGKDEDEDDMDFDEKLLTKKKKPRQKRKLQGLIPQVGYGGERGMYRLDIRGRCS